MAGRPSSLRRSRLDRRLDRIRDSAVSGPLRSHERRYLGRFLRNRLAASGLLVFVLIIAATLLAPLLTSYDPQKIDLTSILRPPSATHWFGTDKTGRDVFARILYGGRISILVGLGSAVLAALIGVSLGCYAGYRGGWLDAVVLRASELVMSFPEIILVLMLVAILGQSLSNLILIFVVTGWGNTFRLTRARMLALREEEYVQALRSFGFTPAEISFVHILPNALGPIMVNVTLTTAAFILAEAGLSFLGLGVPLNIPTWGNILNTAQDLRVLQNNWWMWLPVGCVISLFVLSVNFIGDGLRDATDPSRRAA
ncbi:MAG: ABC transporter permease [Alsobacter sp.]